MYFLITWTTYGSWLPGDPRGFRTRHAKEYVPPPKRYSDGKSYEPEKYKQLYKRSRSHATESVYLNERQKQAAAGAIVKVCSKFSSGAVIAVSGDHVHVFVNLPEEVTTGHFCSRVKSVSSLKLSAYGLKGRVWACRYHAKRIPVRDADNVRRYVISHKTSDAVVMQL
jgi:REP element-mobilizing transposase RayT